VDVLINIIVGAIGSIVATILLFVCTKFYRFGYKERIVYNLEMAENYVWQIENHLLFPSDYDIVVHCAEMLYKCLFEIHVNLYPLSMWRNKRGKKLIRTLLYDASRRCEYVCFVTVGYNGNEEKEARIKNIRKRLYDSSVSDSGSIVKLELELIKRLINSKTQDALRGMKDVNISGLVEINSFKNTGGVNAIMQKQGITRQEYEKVIAIK
jgi:hypothetical protein